MEELKKEQRNCVKFCLKNPAAGVFADPGFGKTRVILESYKLFLEANVIDTLIVVASRKICKLVWPKENRKWGFEFPILELNKGGPEQREEALFHFDRPGIILITHDRIVWLQQFLKKYKKHLNLGRIMLTIDESSKFKSTKSGRYRALKKMLNSFDRRYILTGTPTPHSLMDIYSQIFILDGGERLGNKTNFKNKFFIPCGFMGHDNRPVENAEEKIYKEIKDIVIRYDSSHLNLGELEVVDVEFELDEGMLQTYKTLEKELIVELDDNITIDAAHAGVAVNKLRQIVGGAIYVDRQGNYLAEEKKAKKRKYKVLNDDKIGVLQDLIDEMGGKPCLVAYEFRHEMERLKKAFPKAIFMESGTSDARAEEIESDWNNGLIQLLFGHPDTIGHGLNLQGVNAAVIFFSLTYNYDNYFQFIKRVWRQGQKGTVFVYRLIALRTIDLKILLNLAGKHKTQTDFLNVIKRSQKGDMEMNDKTSKIFANKSNGDKSNANKKVAEKKKVVKKSTPRTKPNPKNGDTSMSKKKAAAKTARKNGKSKVKKDTAVKETPFNFRTYKTVTILRQLTKDEKKSRPRIRLLLEFAKGKKSLSKEAISKHDKGSNYFMLALKNGVKLGVLKVR